MTAILGVPPGRDSAKDVTRDPVHGLDDPLDVGVQVHYIPVYRHPYYARLGYAGGACPIAEDFYARAVSIPMYPAMTDADVERVIETVDRVARDVLG